MNTAPQGRRLVELAAEAGARVQAGGEDVVVTGVGPLSGAGPSEIAFYSNPSYRPQLTGCRAAALIVAPKDAGLPELAQRPLLVSDHPYAAYARIAALFHPEPKVEPGIDPQALIEPGATVDPSARVEAFAVVRAGARIGAGARVGTGAVVGLDADVGDGSVLHPRVIVGDRCIVGRRCVLHPGVVIGADGFGFAFDPEGEHGPVHRKVPQLGIARLEDDVEIGANSCVDRATFGETVIGRGSKLDNLVQIGHNVTLGPLCVFAAQVGIAGSTSVGTGVAMGGQAGVAGHLRIGDLARVAAASGIAHDVESGTTVGGYPGGPIKQWLRMSSALARLPALLGEFRRLVKRVDALESGTGNASGSPTSASGTGES